MEGEREHTVARGKQIVSRIEGASKRQPLTPAWPHQRNGPGGGVCAQRGHSAHMTGRNWGFLLQLAIFLPIQTILLPHNVGQPDVSLFSSGTDRGGSVGPSSRTPGRAALVVAEFLWLAPRVSPRRKREADVILRLVAFHARPWHLL